MNCLAGSIDLKTRNRATPIFRFFNESEPSKVFGIVHRYTRAKYGNFAFIRGLQKATDRLASARQPSDSLVYFHQ